ncbi:uncharacterized protein LOC110849791 [Folsomia candida]|uniref:Elicitor-responsive protein 1 n=1 Tax=Folsomia candida TaxID=158441 RepID=A0A226EBE5_FOLCA|nr:uncharacterized protein LOC110849791 [Folsomia candida]OXA54863.1 Elicitor-responsive protein 1 [Folsomia candida]
MINFSAKNIRNMKYTFPLILLISLSFALTRAQNEGSHFTNLYFTVSGRNLPSNGNPYLLIYHVHDDSSTNLGKTLGVKDNPNPEWNKVFKAKYFHGENVQNQRLFVQVKGLQNTANVFVELSSYMESGQNLSIPLTGEYSGSSLILQGTTPFYFSLQVNNIPATDFNWWGVRTGLSDPYINCYFFSASDPWDAQRSKFHETTVVRNVHDASWWDQPIEYLNYVKGKGQKFLLEVMDHDHMSKDDFLGEAIIDVDEFVRHEAILITPLLNTPKIGQAGQNITLTVKWEGWAQLTEP